MGKIAIDLRSALAEDGKRWTGVRETVLSVLEKSGLPITAKDIYSQVRSQGVNLASVYRTTEMLARRGFAMQVESPDGVRRFELSDRYRPHHHHVVCRNCGEMRDVSGCGVKGIEKRAARLTGFKIVGHHLSLTGLCPRCS
jgi:Fur family ferric uptake transcriptional regulator